MHLFHFSTEQGQGRSGARRTWLIAADTLFAAMVLVPDDYSITAADVEFGADSGPERLIGCVDPTYALRNGSGQKERTLDSASRKPVAVTRHRRNGWPLPRGG